MANQKTTSTTLFNAIADFFRTQGKYIATMIAGLVLVIVLFFAYKLWVIKREQSAQYDFSYLVTEYEKALQVQDFQWDVLLEKFENYYKKHSSSLLLPYYMNYKVNILLNQNRVDEALVELNKMIESIPGSPIIALYEMKRALIQIDDSCGEVKDTGLESLKRLAYDKHNIYRDSAQYYLGLYYWTHYQIDLAREVWQLLVDEQRDEKISSSPWVGHVQEYLNLIIAQREINGY